MDEIFYRLCFIIGLNNSILDFISFISFHKENHPFHICYYLKKYKHLILFYLKKEQLKKINKFYSLHDEIDLIPSVTIHRIRGESNYYNDKSSSIFYQIYSQLNKSKFSKSNEQLFQVNFVGEDGIDDGGLFRDALTHVVKDFQESLFILTPNFQNDHSGREIFIPNPKRKSGNDLRMFEFIGRLIGSCLFSCTVCSGISWPLLIYKFLLQIDIKDSDFKHIDLLYFEIIEMLMNMPAQQQQSQLDSDDVDDDFDDLISLVFTIRSLDGFEVELIPNGKNISVSWNNRLEYIRLAKEFRNNEISLQLNALRNGFIDSCQEFSYFIHWFSPSELQNLIEGDKNVDLDLLRSHTNYINCTIDSPVVTFLWKILHSFDESQRKAFVKFTYGSPVLPSLWEDRQFTVFVIQQKSHTEYNHLPTAHTCSWRLDIPDYPTEDIFREKLVLALQSCDGFTLN